MVDGSAEESLGRIIANTSLPSTGAIVAISRLLVQKGLVTKDELRVALEGLQTPNYNEETKVLYQKLVEQILL